MELTAAREVRAGADQVWEVIADPVSWPRWTPSMREVGLLDGSLALGSRVRIVQPRLPPTVWTVTEFVPGEVLTWAASGPGILTAATHSVRSKPDGTSSLRLGLAQRGPLAPVLAGLIGRLSRRYVELEADGLRAAAEAA
jgi:uncharacterized protein YndB with AHSA1/START domain